VGKIGIGLSGSGNSKDSSRFNGNTQCYKKSKRDSIVRFRVSKNGVRQKKKQKKPPKKRYIKGGARADQMSNESTLRKTSRGLGQKGFAKRVTA